MSDQHNDKQNLRASLYGLMAFGIFSSHDVIIKVLGNSYSSFQLVFFSALFGFPFITIMLIKDQVPGTLRPKHPWWLSLRCGSALVSAVGAFFAFGVLPLAEVYAILFAAPLLITILAIPILGETVRLRRGLAVAFGLVGVLVVLRPGGTEFSLGHVAAMAAAVSGALNSIVARKIGPEERSVVMVLYPVMTNFIAMGIALPFVYQPMPIGDLGAFVLVALMVLLAMICLVNAYQLGDAVMVAPTQYSQIIWAIMFGAIFFDEFPDQTTLVGVGIIILSGLYILKRESTGTNSENTPVLRTRTRIGLSSGLRVGTQLKKSKKSSR
ncbi:DMT family transporter [Cochlodiniinecator piscidefendens]|uniref:DMT family transporter n=1 Tax=Cochlodiniinecator piscidefendens TaxID=2715756 RepID=UPI00140A6C22|nr:DMT family transporter [Cochlodiniinecator piscidefendens]